jgi:galactose mutarotase-like enzyme
MVTQISNGLLTARIAHAGAELKSLYHQALQLEYIWNADPKFWGKSSPVLFPIVGALKENTFLHQSKSFMLTRHGFARDMNFELEEEEPGRAQFLLKSSDKTRPLFPFDFELRIIYLIEQFTLNVIYEVRNLSAESMYFSIGAHPAFNVPLIAGTAYEDYYLKFEQPESSKRYPISKDGLIDSTPTAMLDGDILPLNRELFYQDAIVFKDLKSSMISIRSKKHTHGLDMTFDGFSYFGIWAAKDADFVCLEPWCGIADSVGHNGDITRKEGIHILAPAGNWARTWSLKCY